MKLYHKKGRLLLSSLATESGSMTSHLSYKCGLLFTGGKWEYKASAQVNHVGREKLPKRTGLVGQDNFNPKGKTFSNHSCSIFLCIPILLFLTFPSGLFL